MKHLRTELWPLWPQRLSSGASSINFGDEVARYPSSDEFDPGNHSHLRVLYARLELHVKLGEMTASEADAAKKDLAEVLGVAEVVPTDEERYKAAKQLLETALGQQARF